MMWWQSLHVFVVVNFNFYFNNHPTTLDVFATYVERTWIYSLIIVIFTNLIHTQNVQVLKIGWMYFSTIISFIFSSKIITMIILILYAVFVRNEYKVVNGCIDVNNAILMCIHYAPSFLQQGFIMQPIVIILPSYSVHLARAYYADSIVVKSEDIFGVILVSKWPSVHLIYIHIVPFTPKHRHVFLTTHYFLWGLKATSTVVDVVRLGIQGLIIATTVMWICI